MIILLIAATLAMQTPSDAVCASAYALEAARMQQSGELPGPFTNPESLTPPQRTGMAASRHVIVAGLAWTALATRTPEGRREADASYRALASAPSRAQAAFAACSQLSVEDRLPLVQVPPQPVEGVEQCTMAVADFYAAMRECADLETLRARARDTQSKLEKGVLTCRSADQARSIWAQIGAAAAGADSRGQKARCSAQ